MLGAFLTFLFLSHLAIGKDEDGIAKVNKLIDSVIAGETLTPKEWSDHLSAQSIDVNDLAKTDYPSGIAYGAVVSKIIKSKFADVLAAMTADGAIFKLASAVETQRNFTKTKEEPKSLRLKLAIKVPIVADIQTQDDVKVFEDSRGREIMEWRQYGEEGDLVFNRGAVIVQPNGDNCKVLVVGLHIIKPEKKVPWLGRGTATAFAKTHYGNYIKALESFLGH